MFVMETRGKIFLLAAAKQALGKESWRSSQDIGVLPAVPVSCPPEQGLMGSRPVLPPPPTLRGWPLFIPTWERHGLPFFCFAFLGAFWMGQISLCTPW